jgi:hypothetical protein
MPDNEDSKGPMARWLIRLFMGLVAAPAVGAYVAWRSQLMKSDPGVGVERLVLGGAGVGLVPGLILMVVDVMRERATGKPPKWN